MVDRAVARPLATAYLGYLYTPAGQTIIAQNGNRVRDAAVAKTFAASFPEVRLLTVDDTFGGWDKVQAEHFAAGGILDEIYGDR